MRTPKAIDNAGSDHILSILKKLRLNWLITHFPPRLVRSVYVFVNGFITIAVLALLALVSRSPFVFPSLGPTAYLLFVAPLGRTSSPRNTICGHAIGLICGYAALRCYWRRGATFRRASGNLLAESPCGGTFAFRHWRIHGSPGCESPSRGRDYADRFSGNYFEAARTSNHRSCRAPTGRSSLGDQPACRFALPYMECGAFSERSQFRTRVGKLL